MLLRKIHRVRMSIVVPLWLVSHCQNILRSVCKEGERQNPATAVVCLPLQLLTRAWQAWHKHGAMFEKCPAPACHDILTDGMSCIVDLSKLRNTFCRLLKAK